MPTRSQDAWNKVAVLSLCDEMHKGQWTIDNVHIQKLCFLSELRGREQDLKIAYYRFFRFNNGPYSMALANDVTSLIKQGFVDPESGELLDRGRYFYKYVHSDIQQSETAIHALKIIRETAQTWQKFKGWDIVNEVYKMTVPVDGLGKDMLVKDIPLKTDILVPERSNARDVSPFSSELVEEIQEELSSAPVSFDPDTEEFQEFISARVNRALSIS